MARLAFARPPDKMDMKPIQWDKQETFTAPNGQVGMRYAISDHDGVTYEFSMHDPTIQALLPKSVWFPVYSAPTNCANIKRIDGKLVVLCGFGKPNDPMGNLVFMRVSSRAGYLPSRMTQITDMIMVTLTGFGIQFAKTTFDDLAFTGN